MSSYILPGLVFALLAFAFIKKLNCFDLFVKGAKKGLLLAVDIAPYLIAIFLMTELMNVSGLSEIICQFLSPVFKFFGLPPEVSNLMIIRPFTGSGSLAVLEEILAKYNADSYVGRCASVIMGSSETVFYVTAIFLSATKTKKIGLVIPISLFANFVGAVVGCLMCYIFI